MSTAEGAGFDESPQAREISTTRGVFATLQSATQTRPVPRGAVLLVPGFTGSKEDLALLLPLLSDAGWSVAAFDQRGQYETFGGPDDDYSLEGFAADAQAVALALFGDAEQVHLVGHSFGGLVAATAVIQDPSRWATLSLLCSGPGGLSEGSIYEDALLVAEKVPNDGLEAAFGARLLRDQKRGSPLPAAIEAVNRRRFLASSPDSLAAMARHLTAAPDRTAELVELDLPIGVIRGADDTWPHAAQEALAEALDTHVEVIDGAAHSPAIEQPEATRDALARVFLR